jgi:predicted metal-dependent hydrolase
MAAVAAASTAILPSMAGRSEQIEVRESPRARRLTLKVAPGAPLEIVVPVGTGEREIERMLRRNRDWIDRKTAEAEELAARPALGLDRAGVVWLHGIAVPVQLRGGARSSARLAHGRLLVGGGAEQAAGAIDRWYRREARLRLTEATRREARRLGLRPRRLSIRDPRTRWGSCSPEGALSFSWRLLLAPGEILDYVVVHELCHLRELNHSPAFWRLLDEARPGWRAEARWLRDHGWELGGYLPRLPFQ